MNTFLSFDKAALICFSFLFFISSCMSPQKAATAINQKYAPADLQKDVILLQKILEADHPSLYWYTPKDSIDVYFAQTISSLKDSMDGLEFKNKIAWLVSKIRCGHTEVGLSDQYERAIQKIKQPRFPLAIKTWGDSLVVLGSALQNDSVLRRGTIITSINNISNRLVLDSIFQFISTDGYSDNFKSQVTSFNFAAAYRDAFGVPYRYVIHYLIKRAMIRQRSFIITPPLRQQ